MRRPKRGPALFELLSERGLKASENQDAQGVPVESSVAVAQDAAGVQEGARKDSRTSEGKDSRAGEGKDSRAGEGARRDSRTSEALTPAPLPRGEGGCAARSPVERSPVLVVDGERLHVSLTSMSAAGAAFVLLLIVAAAAGLGYRQGRGRGLGDGYAAGRASYLADTATEIEAARLQAPATYLVGGLLDVGASPPVAGSEPRLSSDVEAGAGEAGWIDGFTYVVAQEFSAKNVSDVEPAQRFLAEHGVETRALPLSSGGVRLITTQGFDRKDPAQRKLADQLLEKIRAIGAQYFASGGRYKLEGYFKTLTGD